MVLGRQLPPPTPSPSGASGQQLVAKGGAFRSTWAPKAPGAPWAPRASKRKFLFILRANTILKLNLGASSNSAPKMWYPVSGG